MRSLNLKMQYKLSTFVNIMLLSLLAGNTAPVFSRSHQQEKCNGCADGSSKSENYFNFNACRFPTEDQNAETALEETDDKIDVTKSYLSEVRKITEKEVDFIKGIIRAERQVRCKHQLHKLKGKQLEDVIQSSAKAEFKEINSDITKIYMKIATVTFLLNHLDTDLSLAAEDCCLSYPSEIYHRLKNRILKKWYTIQDRYGEPIDRSKCEVRVHINFNMPKGCDSIRDVIYLLLQNTREVLNHSKLVIKSVKPGHKRN